MRYIVIKMYKGKLKISKTNNIKKFKKKLLYILQIISTFVEVFKNNVVMVFVT